MRRQFPLPEEDVEFLEAHESTWETLQEGGSRGNRRWLLLHDIAVPEGYSHSEVTVALMIPPGYPDAALDMAYVYPALSRKDGVTIPNLTKQQIGDQSFQRWSRHRTRQHPWRMGEDDIGTHLALVQDWFDREFEKRPTR